MSQRTSSAEDGADTADGVTESGTRSGTLALGRRRYLATIGAVTTALAGCSELNLLDRSTEQTPTDGREYHTYSKSVLAEKYPAVELLSVSPPNGQTRDRSSYRSFTTPVRAAYIRNHYDSPKLRESDHTISVEGRVETSFELSMDSLRSEYSTTEVAHTMQCAGNGRGYFDPSVAGNQWTSGAVSTAIYGGTPVRELLDRAGPTVDRSGYVAVMGADAPEGKPVYTRSIPISKLRDDCLLAYERNGEVLTAEHGFPVRLVVPGWYGCNSVKWVRRMVVMKGMVRDDDGGPLDDPSRYTHWQQSSYRLQPGTTTEPVQHESIETFDTADQMDTADIEYPYCYAMLVKSVIAKPTEGDELSAGDGPITIGGVAWAGDHEVAAVDVSTDGGETFESASFVGQDRGPSAWRQFEYEWTPTAGEHTLVSRATDQAGRTQPATIDSDEDGPMQITDDEFPWNMKGYGSNAYMPEAVTVTVTGQQ